MSRQNGGNLIRRRISADGAASAVFECDLSRRGSLNTLIEALEQYKSRMPEYLDYFVNRLAKEGLSVAKQSYSNAQGDSRECELTITDAQTKGTTVTIQILFTGEDVLFWEFGAGIYYNNGKAHPKAAEMGMGVGTYPDQTHAINPGYWWYRGDDGNLHFSLGTEAAMPLYKAEIEMIKKIDKVAQGAFW